MFIILHWWILKYLTLWFCEISVIHYALRANFQPTNNVQYLLCIIFPHTRGFDKEDIFGLPQLWDILNFKLSKYTYLVKLRRIFVFSSQQSITKCCSWMWTWSGRDIGLEKENIFSWWIWRRQMTFIPWCWSSHKESRGRCRMVSTEWGGGWTAKTLDP